MMNNIAVIEYISILHSYFILKISFINAYFANMNEKYLIYFPPLIKINNSLLIYFLVKDAQKSIFPAA